MENEILQQILSKLDNLEQGQANLAKELQSLKSITLRMEQDHGKKLQALFDGYSANYEIIERYDPRITKLERTVEKLAFEVQYLKSAK